jgi:putative inorganic carbon (HCO3(-)) transporter
MSSSTHLRDPIALRRWGPAVAAPLFAAAVAVAAGAGPGDPRRVAAALLIAGIVVYVVAIVPPAWTLSAGLFLSVFGSNWQAMGLPRSVAPDRLVIALALLAIVVRAPGARDRLALRIRPVHALMYAAAAYAIASALAVGTLTERSGFFNLLDRLGILPWLVFALAPSALFRERDRSVFLATLVALGVYLGATALFETINLRALVFPRYISDPSVGIHFGRARGPFAQAAINGFAMYACILASVLALRVWRRWWPRLLAGAAIVLCAEGLLFTLQRSIWLGAAVATLGTMLLVRDLRRFVVPSVLACAVAVGVSIAVVPGLAEKVKTRQESSGTVRERRALNDAAFNMVAARPLVGVGWNMFPARSGEYFEVTDSYSLETKRGAPLHNAYLANAVELGLVGAGLWLLVMLVGLGGTIIRRGPPAVRPWRIALGALFFLWLGVAAASPLLASFHGLVLWLWAAVVVAGEEATVQPLAGGR